MYKPDAFLKDALESQTQELKKKKPPQRKKTPPFPPKKTGCGWGGEVGEIAPPSRLPEDPSLTPGTHKMGGEN